MSSGLANPNAVHVRPVREYLLIVESDALTHRCAVTPRLGPEGWGEGC